MKKIVFILKGFKGIDKVRFLVFLAIIKFYWIVLKDSIYTNQKNYKFNILLYGQQRTINIRMQDVATFFEVFYIEIYKSSLKKCEVIVDLGAHIGLASLYFHTIYPQAKIYCVEPSSASFDLLVLNIQEAHHYKLAISNNNGTGFIKESVNGVNNSLNKSGTEVETITFPDLLTKLNIQKIDLLKIDIEGAESLLFESVNDWKNKVDNVIMECHGNANEITQQLQTTTIKYKIV